MAKLIFGGDGTPYLFTSHLFIYKIFGDVIKRNFYYKMGECYRFYIMHLKEGIVSNRCREPTYIGSTSCLLNKRLIQHKAKTRNSLKLNKMEKYVIQYGTENWEISLIGIANCTRKYSKCIEQKFIDYLKPSMNERFAYGTHKEKKLQQNREYAKMFIYLTSPQGQGHHNSVSQLLWACIT